jgi:hypothetical protein
MISALEWEVLSFFEVEPQRLDPEVPWPYNGFLYEIERDGLVFSCSVAPSYKDVRMTLSRGNDRLYELNATNVVDVRYRREYGHETLEVVLSERESVTLRVKPMIVIAQIFDGHTNVALRIEGAK